MTEPSPDLQRLQALVRDEPIPSEGGDTDAAVEALLEGRLDAEAAQALASRAIDEPGLALQLRVAAAMAEARREETANHGAATRPASRWPWALGFAAAAALLMYAFVRPPSLTESDGKTIRAAPTQALAPTKPSASLTRDGFVLEWTGGPAGARYDLFVTTAQLQPVHQVRGLTESKHQVPAKALRTHAAGTRLLWRVVAVTEDGRRVHSTAFEVVLR